MKWKKSAALGIAAGLALGATLTATPASAEPVSPGYVLVGSDTLQESLNALTNGTTVTGVSVRVTANSRPLGNYDAFGSPAIQTKSLGAFFGRPSGSGAGVTALRASITGNPYSVSTSPTIPAANITGQVDIARSSSSPGGNANPNGLLAYVPYARDAVSYAYTAANPAAAAVIGSLTTAQLAQIFSAATPTTISGVTITPRLPQENSGTRQFFLQAIGGVTPGAAVPASDHTTVAENDATELTGANQVAPNQIIPFSSASWIAQVNGASGVNTVAAAPGVELGGPNGVAPFTVGGGGVLVPNSAFYGGNYGRDTYLVVQRARIEAGPNFDPALATLVSHSGGVNSLVTFGAPPNTPGAVKARFGFLAPSTTAITYAFTTL